MHADERDAFLGELLVPALVPRIVVDAVDSAEGPEVKDDHLTLEVAELDGLGVDPVRDPCQFRGRNFHGNRSLGKCRSGTQEHAENEK
jgi:hypothetical protein